MAFNNVSQPFCYYICLRVCVFVNVCLCVCMSVPRRIPTLLHGMGCNLEEW